jgi:hypothetical protein
MCKESRMKIEIKELEYHRNGICGTPFHAVLFYHNGRKFLATVFEQPGNVAVICLDRVKEHGVRFAYNSWRGDYYEGALRSAIKEKWDLKPNFVDNGD